MDGYHAYTMPSEHLLPISLPECSRRYCQRLKQLTDILDAQRFVTGYRRLLPIGTPESIKDIAIEQIISQKELWWDVRGETADLLPPEAWILTGLDCDDDSENSCALH